MRWTKEAYQDGFKDPFNEAQGIYGKPTYTPLIKRTANNELVLDFPMSMDPGKTDPSGLVKFDGFLWKTGYGGAGSAAINWPGHLPEATISRNMKLGCRRTVGTTAPDFAQEYT